MFKRLVGIEPLELIPTANIKLESFAETLILYTDMPSSVDEIVERIGDADAVLLSHRTLPKCEIYWYVLLVVFSRKCQCGY